VCRIVARLGCVPVHSADLLRGRCGLVAQSVADPGRLQRDGWGVGLWWGERWSVEKSERPIFRDQAAIDRIGSIRAITVLAHVRQASNPSGVPRYRLLRSVNSQPFQDGRWLFAHNGTLLIVREAMAVLGRDRWLVQGENDSEVFFRLLMRSLLEDARRDPARAIPATIRRIWRMWRECYRRYPKLSAPCSLLNMVLTDGERLWACCYDARPRKRWVRSLCVQGTSFAQMTFRVERRSLTVASEPADVSSAWQPLPHGHVLMASRSSRSVAWSVRSLGVL